MKKVVNLGNGKVNIRRPKRQRFTADYKLQILAKAETCKGTGQVAAMGFATRFPWPRRLSADVGRSLNSGRLLSQRR